ncbi:tetratricopeptide repeat protein, partial [Bacteroidota bacterium]
IDIDVTARFPEKYFDKKATVVATPVLVFDGGEKALQSITIQGEKVEANNKVINFESGGKFNYKTSIPYTDDMRLSKLVFRLEATKKGKKLDFLPLKIADGVIATSSLLKSENAKPISAKDNFKRIIPESFSADIHYLINSPLVRWSEMKSEDVNEFIEAIKAANEKENYKLRGLDISAYASFDGEQDFNAELSENRGKTAKEYMSGEMKKAEVEEAAKGTFYQEKSTAEDWEGFKDLVGKSNIQDKDLILRVLSRYSDPNVREQEIKNIAETYKVLTDEILPKLRRSVMTVNVDVIGKSDSEIANLSASNIKELNLEEQLYSATLTDDINKKHDIYKNVTEQFDNCYRGFNNLGSTLVEMGKIDEAKMAFEKANQLYSKSTIVQNNLGAIALIEGDYDKAEGYLRSASGAGKQVSNNLGIINIKKGDYQRAISGFGSDCDFNAALAKVLAGDNNGALKTLDCIEDQDAMVYYLRAVIGARTKDSSMIMKNLEKACSMDSSLKAYATTDLEFGKYFEDNNFKSIVK